MPKFRVYYHGPEELVIEAENDVLAEIEFLNYLEREFPFFGEELDEEEVTELTPEGEESGS